jgi:integrase
VAERYISTESTRLSAKTISEIKRTFENHLYPSWGAQALHGISSADLTLMLDQKSVGTAREIRKYVSGLYSWAMARGLAERNPVALLDTKTRRRLSYPDNHGRALDDEEMRALWSAAGAMGYPYGRFYQLLMLTGQRPYEWRDARWSEIREGALVIPRERFKTRRRAHAIPLVPAVTEILVTLRRESCCDWLFHKRGACGPINGQSKRDADLAKRANVQQFTVYDFRKTCATRLASLGVDPFLIDQVQSRSLTPLQRTYIRHDYAAEKRAVMQKYADHLLQVLQASPAPQVAMPG